MSGTVEVAAWGSSPLTRGKQPDVRHRRGLTGLIPAHAGKTAHGRRHRHRPRAHPRSRGENSPPRRGVSSTVGSSPLTRGKLSSWWTGTWDGGLIPAHAGKTSASTWTRFAPRAHPRSRGENSQRAAGDGSNTGSSPLTRGKQGDGMCAFGGFGLIPAHTGKTDERLLARAQGEAHPRSRGENVMQVRGDNGIEGSSPLTRGKLLRPSRATTPRRLIPAHAGKTVTCCPPHLRAGSSPLTRGKHLRYLHRRRREGLIPAHAGKTHREESGERDEWAHPRSRGENSEG